MRLAAALLFLAGLCTAAFAEGKVALVVGNDAYQEVPALKKAVNDANAVGDALKGLGFEVIVVENATRNALSRGLVAIEGKVKPGDTALFFFAGHGFEANGENFLLPTDVPEASEGEEGLVKDASFNAAEVIERLQATGAATVIAILDACRDNPFAAAGKRGVGGQTRGLARMDPAEGVFILFSAAAKQEALDNLGEGDSEPNSVFTRELIKTLSRPGLSLVDIAKETQTRVKALAASIGHAQTPAYYDQISGNFFLKPLAEGDKPAPVAEEGTLLTEVTAWKAISGSSNAADFAGYLGRYGDGGLFAEEARRKLAALTPAEEVPEADRTALIDTCIRLTAKPLDPTYGDIPRVGDKDLDWRQAEEACDRARAAAPEDAKVAFGLGRVLDHDATRRSEALQLLEEAANRGSPGAANYAAAIYYQGDGVPVDYTRARLYYQQAERGGYLGSVVRYAQMVETGLGGPADPALAMGILTSAAEAGVPEAAFDLGVRYDQAVGVKRDPKAARKWYEMAVKGGESFAAFTLAILVGHGEGGPVDRKRAADLVIQAFAGDFDPAAGPATEKRRAAYEQAVAAEAAAKADVDFKQQAFDRQQSLFNAGAISQGDFDAAERDLHTAEATLSEATGNARSALAALDAARPSKDMRAMLPKFDRRVLAELEKALAAEGFDPGKVDGTFDDKSFAALDAAAARRGAAKQE